MGARERTDAPSIERSERSAFGPLGRVSTLKSRFAKPISRLAGGAIRFGLPQRGAFPASRSGLGCPVRKQRRTA
jgi:hypothetical protein